MIFLNNRFVLFSQRSRSLFVVNVFWFNNELTPNHHHVNPNAYYQVVNEAIRKKQHICFIYVNSTRLQE